MKGTTDQKDYLANNHATSTRPYLMCEINLNLFNSIEDWSDDVYGPATERQLQNQKKKFPVESITKPNRPRAGIYVPEKFKNIGDKWYDNPGKNNIGVSGFGTYDPDGDFWTLPPRAMYATATRPYKYFMPVNNEKDTNIASIPVTYTNSVYSNKVVIGFENSVSYPTEYEVYLDYWGSDHLVASDEPLDDDGRLILYWDGNAGEWTTTAPAIFYYGDSVSLDAIRVDVQAMNHSKARVGVIEISARMQFDLSDRLISWNDAKNFEEGDSLAPVGSVSANSANIVLSNDDYAFDEGNGSQPYATLADYTQKYAEFRLEVDVDGERVPEFTMFAETWDIADGAVANVTAFDYANFLQTTEAPNMVVKDVSPTQAIWRMLELVGCNNVILRRNEGQKEPVMPFFFCSDEETVWDAIKAVCASFQYAVYVDDFGRVVICTNKYLYKPERSATWDFSADDSNSPQLADIASHHYEDSDPINKISIKYRPIGKSASNDPSIKPKGGDVSNIALSNRVVYSEENPINLGVAKLQNELSPSAVEAKIVPGAVASANWGSFSGHFVVDQEVIKFGALEYSYIRRDDKTSDKAQIHNKEELQNLLAEAIGTVKFTGKVLELERGMFDTEAITHSAAIAGWDARTGDEKYVLSKSSNGNYYLEISKPKAGKNRTESAYKLLDREYKTFTTKIRIPKQSTVQQSGGMVLWPVVDGNKQITSGIYIEVTPTKKGKKNIWIMPIGGGEVKRGSASKFFKRTINRDEWYTLSAKTKAISGGKTQITVYLNKDKVGVFETTKTTNSAVALMATGKSKIQFDSFSATTDETDSTRYADEADMIEDIFARDDKMRNRPLAYREGFENYARQAYIEDIRYTLGPALTVKFVPFTTSKIKYKSKYSGNLVAKTGEIASAISKATPFSAYIAVANISPHSRLLSDPSVGGGYPQMYGQIVSRYDEIEYTDKRDASIKLLGEQKLELGSDDAKWLSKHKDVEDLSDWILDIWSDGPERHTMTVNANPLIEVGDVVTINYPVKGIYGGDDEFVVTRVENSWQDGLTTTITAIKLA